ncbi:probable inactive 1-aminocyclopropane-1-carboxylate synthase-like protein 2 isoform X2 [Xenia sp. Carnegie-2017]|uniref:probable inactive 1-aminocyclopropane-1-carboxylate synthase-like protein 2 isoform X2 n=1 Tax=Xenia sp. Carnegie-2017 TaxID=2897299 RepID=UPI001F0348BE|nr:probable inactive 1-aminocyclopropane-1-carboxylate synthase-like protein 2 isoform X2 [Xenia sp. Carnegie-2017]
MADGKSTSCDVSERCLTYKNVDFLLLHYMIRYIRNKYDEKDNPQGIINMGTSENKIIADLVSAKLNECNTFKEEHSHYGDFKGMKRFRTSLAAFFERYMKPLERIDPNHITVFNGAASLVKTVCASICDRKEAILIPTPYYGGFDEDVCLENEIVLFPVYLSSEPDPETKMPFELTMDDLENALAKAKKQGLTVRGLLICNPNNPLGTVYTEKQVLACLEFTQRHSLHLISDELYCLSIFEEGVNMTSAVSVKGSLDPHRLHIIWGFSKDFGLSGIRVAVMYSRNKDILASLTNIAIFYSTPLYIQEMLNHMISDYDWLDNVLIPTNIKRLRQCHAVVTTALKTLNIPMLPSCSGLYIWIDLREYLKPLTFEREKYVAELMMENGVYINAGSLFKCVEPGWFRVVFASDLGMIRKGIGRVLETLKKIQNDNVNCKL